MLAQKSGALIHVRSSDMVFKALQQMRDNRVRSVLVIDDVVKDIIREMGHTISFLETYIKGHGVP